MSLFSHTVFSLLLLGLLAECQVPGSRQGDWIQLFDGKTLDDWTVKIRGHEVGVDPDNTFRVEDGLLKVSYENYEGDYDGRFGHLFYKESFDRYFLRVEYRFVGEQVAGGPGWAWRNSGLMLHGQSPESMGVTQDFPISIEMQLLGGDGQNRRTNANLCTPGTNVVMGGKLDQRHCINSTSATCHGDEWYTVLVEVRGGEVIRHFLGGDQVMEYFDPQLDVRDPGAQRIMPDSGDLILHGGTISLQSESHPIEFRKIELKYLDE